MPDQDPYAGLGTIIEGDPFETALTPEEQTSFETWKQTNAPDDSGEDYDWRGAFKAGAKADDKGHWPDTYKKPNHPTFSEDSVYAPLAPDKAGRWQGDTFIKPEDIAADPYAGIGKGVPDTVSIFLNNLAADDRLKPEDRTAIADKVWQTYEAAQKTDPGIGTRFWEHFKKGWSDETLLGSMVRLAGNVPAERPQTREESELPHIERELAIRRGEPDEMMGRRWYYDYPQAMLEAERARLLAEIPVKVAEGEKRHYDAVVSRYMDTAQRLADFEGMPDVTEKDSVIATALHGTAAVTGRIGGGILSPESVIPVTRTGPLWKRVLVQGAANVGAGAVAEPFIQAANISEGTQNEISVTQALWGAGLNFLGGAAFELGGTGIKAASEKFNALPVVERTKERAGQMIREVIDRIKAGGELTPEQQAGVDAMEKEIANIAEQAAPSGEQSLPGMGPPPAEPVPEPPRPTELPDQTVITLQREEPNAPGYLSIQVFDPNAPEGRGQSMTPGQLAAEGWDIPFIPDDTPSGNYTLGQLRQMAEMKMYQGVELRPLGFTPNGGIPKAPDVDVAGANALGLLVREPVREMPRVAPVENLQTHDMGGGTPKFETVELTDDVPELGARGIKGNTVRVDELRKAGYTLPDTVAPREPRSVTFGEPETPTQKTNVEEKEKADAPGVLTPDQIYDASREEFRAASKEFSAVQKQYRARQIGNEEFLAAHEKFKAAQEKADAAETAYIDAKNAETKAKPKPAEKPAEPQPTPAPAPEGMKATTTAELEKKFAPTYLKAREVSTLATPKQLRVQKEFLRDALLAAANDAPDVATMTPEGAADLAALDVKEKRDAIIAKYAAGSMVFDPGQRIRAMHAEHIIVEVPDDGTFRIRNEKRTLKAFAEVTRKEFGKGLKPTGPTMPGTSATQFPAVKRNPTTEDITEAVGLASVKEGKGGDGRAHLEHVYQDGQYTVGTDGRRMTVALGGKGETGDAIRARYKTKDRPDGPTMYNWKQVMPEDIVTITGSRIRIDPDAPGWSRIQLDTEDALKTILRGSLVAGDNTSKNKDIKNAIALHDVDGKLGVSAASPDFGDFSSAGVTDAHPQRLAIDPNYLMDALTAARRMGHERVDLYWKDSIAPIVITDGKQHVTIVMPVRSNIVDVPKAKLPKAPHKPAKRGKSVKGGEIPEVLPHPLHEPAQLPDGRAADDAPMMPARAGEAAPALRVNKATLPRKITAPPLENPDTPVSLGEIRRYIRKALDIPVRFGVNRLPALGYFITRAEVIRLKAINDIPTLAHEVGHYLHKIIFRGTTTAPKRGRVSAASAQRSTAYSDFNKAFDDELLPMGAATSLPSYTRHQVRMEGVAEFTREWMQDRVKALSLAPKFAALFEAELSGKHPEVWKAVETARKMLGKYINQPSAMKVRAQVVSGYTPPPRSFREFAQRLYNRWVNDLEPINRAIRQLQEYGLHPDTARALGTAAINYSGVRGKVDYDLMHAQTDLNGNRVGESFQEIIGGLSANDRMELRDYLVAKRTMEVLKRGIDTGIKSADARATVKLYRAKYEPLRVRLAKFQSNALQLLVDGGLISPDLAARLRAENPMYVPLQRLTESVGAGQHGVGKGFINTPTGIKRIRGSDREIIDPLESIIANLYTFRDLAERNRIAQLFTGAVASTEGGGRFLDRVVRRMKPVQLSDEAVRDQLTRKLREGGMDDDAIEELMDSMPDLAITLWKAARTENAGKGVFKVWHGGKDYYYQADDPELLRGLALTGREEINTVNNLIGSSLKFARLATSIKRAGATLTLEFIARNPFKDQITAGVNSEHGFIPLFDGFRGMLSALRKDEDYWDWLRAGGKYSEFVAIDGSDYQKRIADIAKTSGGRQILDLMNPLNVLDTLQRASTLMEASTRIAEFRRARKAGANMAEAAAASKDVTLNFARAGTAGRVWNQYIAFFNAQIQDVDKMIRAHRTRPFQTMAKAALYISGPSAVLWYLNKDDPVMQKLPEWRKTFFWNLNATTLAREIGMIGRNETLVLSLPKPFLLGHLYGTSVEKALDYANGRDPKAVAKYFKGLGAVGGVNIIPDLAQPVIENVSNYSFFRDQQLEGPSLQNLPPEMRATAQTSQVARAIGETFGVSPIMIDNLVRGYGAGLGRMTTDAIDFLLVKTNLRDVPEPPAKTWRELPGIRGFIASPYAASSDVETFYTGTKGAEQRLHGMQAHGDLSSPQAREYWEKNRNALVYYNRVMNPDDPPSEQYTRMTAIRRRRDKLADIGRAMSRVQNSRHMTPERKRERLLELGKQRDAVAETGVRMLHPDDR